MMRDSEVPMTMDSRRKIEDLASDIDDVATSAEELQTDPKIYAHAEELKRLQRALAQASDVTDALNEKIDERD